MLKVSVIIPVYNAERHLRECLDSVLAQTYRDWECVCVDDGSTDESGHILSEYAQRDSRIMVIHQRNAGAAAARNAAVAIASGDWICFLDSDDVYSPYWIETALSVSKEGADFVRQGYFCGREFFDGFGSVEEGVKCYAYAETAAAEWCWQVLPSKGFLCLCLVRRDIVQRVSFDEKITNKEDSVWLMSLIPQFKRICVTDYCGYFYRQSEDSLSKRKKDTLQCVAYLDALRKIWEEQRNWRRERNLGELVSKELGRCASQNVIEWIINGERKILADVLKVRKSYFNLVGSRGFLDRWYGQERYRMAFAVWRQFGWMWAVRLIDSLLHLLRKIRKTINL